MKNTIKHSLLAIALLSASCAVFADKGNPAKKAYDLPTYTIEDIASLPAPKAHAIPSVSAEFIGMDLRVKFTVTTEGKAESVRLEKPLSSYSDVERMSFANRIQLAVADWEFEPALDNDGNAIAVKVVMPVKVVEKRGKTTALASLVLDSAAYARS